MTDSAHHRLAAYGTLRPGQAHHDEMSGLAGSWRAGVVRGHLHPDGVGPTQGYRALVLDPAGPVVPVDVLESPDLPAHWARIDAFEGEGYRRVVVEVQTDDGPLPASIYVLDV